MRIFNQMKNYQKNLRILKLEILNNHRYMFHISPYIYFSNNIISLCDHYKNMNNSLKSNILSINFKNKNLTSIAEFTCFDDN